MSKKWKALKYKTLSFILPKLAQNIVKLVMMTCRKTTYGIENLHDISNTGCFIALWHNNLALAPYFFGYIAHEAKYHAVVSNSRDGLLLANIIGSFPNGEVIKVPHNARHRALKQILEQIAPGHAIIITPDGPRGPKYDIKPGLLFAAQKSKAPTIPFYWKASSYWRLPTWDGMIIPKPFSKIEFHIASPINVKDDPNSKDLLKKEITAALPNIDKIF